MKSCVRILSQSLLALTLLTAAEGAEPRVFTSVTGSTVKAELVSMKDGVATLKREDGQTFTLSLESFSEADRAYLKTQEKPSQTQPISEGELAPAPPNSVVIEALIDGPSELRVKKDGIYWINGGNAKPGRHEGREHPTYVDDKAWRPIWREAREDRGVDRCSTKVMANLDPDKLEFKLLNVSRNRGAPGLIKRDKIEVSKIDGEVSITIPDSQGGSMWYRFALIRKE